MADYPINVFDADCPSRRTLDLIADQWTALIIYALGEETKRHGELKAGIGGISHKMLTQTLRKLERQGIVRRTVYPVTPPRVEYALTELGKTLLEPLQVLCHWAEQYLDQTRAARELYDRQIGAVRR